MKLNEYTVIRGDVVLLVPYEKYHVPLYHEWMKSEELQVLTASEPLSLEEEYSMQKTWRTDPDKCTFIILDKTVYDSSKDEIQAMVGDTNFFLKKENEEMIAEVEIMIAEKSARGKGLGKEALLLMLRYGVENLKINRFEAKIGIDNEKSLSLFMKIGFQKVSENDIFKEILLQKEINDSFKKWLTTQTNSYCQEERKTTQS